MTSFATAAAAVETAKATLASANAALISAADAADKISASGSRIPGHVATGNGTYTVTVDAAGASHVVETLPVR